MRLHEHADLLDEVQRITFQYFLEHANPDNGLVCDSTQPRSPASIAGVGFALSSYPVGVERGLMSRSQACALTLAAVRFFDGADQSGAVDGIGYKGFFYHFLDMQTGRRAWQSELSTIDTTFLIAGMLTAARYFDAEDAQELEIRQRTQAIYARIDWRWALNGGRTISMGWKPESGFLPWRWVGYNEALLLYVLALGAPEHAIEADAYAAWLEGYRWKNIYGYQHVYAGPLFIHQYSHTWIDFRAIQDLWMQTHSIDYFENSRRATYVQHEYAKRNPRHFKGYNKLSWGFTACDGPGPCTRRVDGRQRTFYDYLARGAPWGPDDGTIAPWATLASLPFAPEIVLPSMAYMHKHMPEEHRNQYGFKCSFNPSFAQGEHVIGWISPWHFVLNQGPTVLMIENYRNGLIWRLMRETDCIRRGLERAGFRGGWLNR